MILGLLALFASMPTLAATPPAIPPVTVAGITYSFVGSPEQRINRIQITPANGRAVGVDDPVEIRRIYRALLDHPAINSLADHPPGFSANSAWIEPTLEYATAIEKNMRFLESTNIRIEAAASETWNLASRSAGPPGRKALTTLREVRPGGQLYHFFYNAKHQLTAIGVRGDSKESNYLVRSMLQMDRLYRELIRHTDNPLPSYRDVFGTAMDDCRWAVRSAR